MTLWPAPNPTHRPVGFCTRCRQPRVREWFWGPVTCGCGTVKRDGKQRRLEAVK